MATTYVSLANLQKYDGLLKTYIADGWYDKSAIDDFLAIIEAREANYVTKSVNDLVNYYTKSETYTKTEVQSLISTIPTFAIVVVNELPTEDISPTTVYLVRNEEQNGNMYTEYIYVNNQWEELGSQDVNLDDYYTKEEVNDLIPEKVSDLNNDLNFVPSEDFGDYAVTGIKGESELVYQKGNLTLNKRMVGLSLVENKSPAQILAQLTDTNITSALGYAPLDSAAYVANSSSNDGYVPKSNGATNKFWGTDSSGITGWQDAPTGPDVSNKMNKDGSNADSNVTFAGTLTVGSRNGASTVGTKSASFGSLNSASGDYSFANGGNAVAVGNYSHAEGNVTAAHGNCSHTEGWHTIAAYDFQHIQGKYNDNKSNTLFEIGSGSSAADLKNAFEVYSNGSLSQDNGTTKFKFTSYNGQKGYYDENGTFNAISDKADLTDLAPAFSTSTTYAVGDYVTYNGDFWRCTYAHTGSWDANDFVQVTISGCLSNFYSTADASGASFYDDATIPFFSPMSGYRSKISWYDFKGYIETYCDTLYKGINVHDSWNQVSSKPFDSIGMGLIALENSGSFTLNASVAAFASEGTASATNTHYTTVVAYKSGAYTAYTLETYMETSTKTTLSGVDSFTFTNSSIKTTSLIDVYCDKFGVSPIDVVVSTSVCTVKFASSDNVISCRIYIKP